MEFDRGKLIVVAGAGGFIGGHLLAELKTRGHTRIRAVDVKPVQRWYQQHAEVENTSLDLRDQPACHAATEGASYVFNLAADMGGMGFIETHKADCMVSVLINTNLLLAARDHGVEHFMFGSSACVYNTDKQVDPNVTALKEEDAYPGSRRMDTAGRSCSASACAVTSWRTTGSQSACPASTTSMGRTARTTGVARRRLRRSVAR